MWESGVEGSFIWEVYGGRDGLITDLSTLYYRHLFQAYHLVVIATYFSHFVSGQLPGGGGVHSDTE